MRSASFPFRPCRPRFGVADAPLRHSRESMSSRKQRRESSSSFPRKRESSHSCDNPPCFHPSDPTPWRPASLSAMGLDTMFLNPWKALSGEKRRSGNGIGQGKLRGSRFLLSGFPPPLPRGHAFAGMTEWASVKLGCGLLPPGFLPAGQAPQKRRNDGLTPVAPFPPCLTRTKAGRSPFVIT